MKHDNARVFDDTNNNIKYEILFINRTGTPIVVSKGNTIDTAYEAGIKLCNILKVIPSQYRVNTL